MTRTSWWLPLGLWSATASGLVTTIHGLRSSLGLSMEATGGSEIVNRIDQEGDDDGSEIWVFEEEAETSVVHNSPRTLPSLKLEEISPNSQQIKLVQDQHTLDLIKKAKKKSEPYPQMDFKKEDLLDNNHLPLQASMEPLRSENFLHSPSFDMPDADLLSHLIELVNEISNIGEYSKRIFKTECSNLTRRVKLLAPLFDEVKEQTRSLPEEALSCFRLIENAMQSARELLKSCHFGSKLYSVLERDSVLAQFAIVTKELEQALDGVPYTLLEISDEVQEQVELVHLQLKRAKGRADIQDIELYNDITSILLQESDTEATNASLKRLAEKLSLKTQSDIKQERRALDNELAKGGAKSKNVNELLSLLEQLSEIAANNIISLDTLENDSLSENLSSPIIPDDFRCPISLELMKDPVIVATGQTYERTCIQKWIDEGNKTCPKTRQTLTHLILTPNYVLKSLIAQWCETHGIELPKKIPPGDRQAIEVLLQKLALGAPDVQRAVAGEIRMLAKRSGDNRICIAEAGAIPSLVNLLSSSDESTQEHAVTALLNLSIHDANKALIVSAKAIGPIVEVLKNGSMEARENAAATLFSLSVVDENKVTIGSSGAIPALVSLLREGSSRGKKDAATALFNLSIYQGNKAKAVRANVVPPLMSLLVDPSSDMVDEALAILAILTTHQEGRAAISQASAMPVLVELLKSGSPRNKENAAAVLLALCMNDPSLTAQAVQLGVRGPLSELSTNGTPRARRKASSLLEHTTKFVGGSALLGAFEQTHK